MDVECLRVVFNEGLEERKGWKVWKVVDVLDGSG